MLRLMMDHHPQIACLGEFEEAVSQAGDEGWPDVAWYRAWLTQDRAFASKRLEIDHRIDSYSELVKSLWAQLASRTTKPIRGFCVHSRFDRLQDIWPNIRFVFLVRDPRDVAPSCARMGWVGEPTRGARYWTRSTSRWLRLHESLPASRFVELTYESLLADLPGSLGQCCRLLGQSFDPAMLEYHRHSTYDAPDPSLANRWLHHLTPRQAELIDLQCQPMMSQYGYVSSVPVPKAPSLIERLMLARANRIGKLRWQFRRYGAFLSIAWILGSRLSVHSPVRRYVARRINAVRRRNLR